MTYQWAFGDGGTASGNPAIHRYKAAGVYTAIVTATNSAGSATATTEAVINAPEPNAYTLYLPMVTRNASALVRIIRVYLPMITRGVSLQMVIYAPFVRRDLATLNLVGNFIFK